MFGGTQNLPQPTQKPFGINDNRIGTNEQARPVPMLAGRQRLGVTFISDIFNASAVAVYQALGKDQSQTTGYNYYGSFAVAICRGPVDELVDVFLNSDTVYSSSTVLVANSLTRAGAVATFTTLNPHGLATGDTVVISGVDQPEYNKTAVITVTGPTTFTYAITGTPASPATAADNVAIYGYIKLPPVKRDIDHPDYADIVIPNYGPFRIYWGTETQEPDPTLALSGLAHPAYRGLCYAVFNGLYFGFQQTSVQNIEFVLGRYPRPSWWAGGGPAINIGDDCNPAAVAADWLQDARCGHGLPDSAIDTGAMLDVAQTLADEGLGVSAILTRSMDSSQLLTQLSEYFDGLPSITADGKFSLDAVRPAADVGALPVVTIGMLTAKPTFTPSDWTTAPNYTAIVFNDRSLDYKENSAAWPDAGAFSITGQADAVTLQRPWLTRLELATAVAGAVGRLNAIPNVNGTLKIRMIAATYDALTPGALFILDYAPRNLSNLVLRVTDRTIRSPGAAEFEVSFKVDRSYLYSTAALGAERVLIKKPSILAAPSALKVLELPAGLSPDGQPAVVVLAARQDGLQVGVNVYIDSNYTG